MSERLFLSILYHQKVLAALVSNLSDPISKALIEAEKLVAALKDIMTNPTPAQHLALLKHTDVRAQLEEPYDTVTRWAESMAVTAALSTLTQIGAFGRLPLEGSISAKDLAADVNVDVSVITRAMRVILVNGIGTETAPDEYQQNMLSMVLQPQALGAFFSLCMDFTRTWVKLPEYLKTHSPVDLYDSKKLPFVYADGKEGLTYYEVLNEDEEQRVIWTNTMQQMEKNMPILGMFLFASLKEQVETEPERPFICFGAPVILQDLPIVINTLKTEELPGITPTVHDISPHSLSRVCIPVSTSKYTLTSADAHVYFLRHLLHDFYIPLCLDILRNVVPAMGLDSRLIICDMLVPEKVEVGGPTELYWLDFSLLTISGRERTLKEFNEMFDEVGLELVQVYPSGIGNTAMLETRLKKA
ncbi:S-adenosyl-L-methionine-dependent methyltransferase [Cadophora sp. DSE1049]|nr:S-adenosyl-L-methionine-dependent methyltransferase [Cadophora sp. DSE1049]